jgi:GAF domain-containing protein
LWSLFELSSLPVLGLQAFLGTTLERVAVVFGASGATIFLDNGDGVFGLVAKTGALAQIPLGAVVEVDYGLAGHAIATRKSLIVDDRVAENVAGRHRADVASALIVPLMNGNQAVGVLNLSRSTEESAFGAEDLAKAEAVAHTIALAITNAKLVAQTQAALQEAQNRHETLRGVLDSVGSAGD